MMERCRTRTPEPELHMTNSYDPNRLLARTTEAAWRRLLAWATESERPDDPDTRASRNQQEAVEPGSAPDRDSDLRLERDDGASQEGA